MNAGATVYRAKDAFDFDGRHFDTGSVLVDGATISLADLARWRAARDTPVYGLPRFPAARYAIAKPKVAIWTGSHNVVPNPENGDGLHERVRTTAGCASRCRRRSDPRRAADRPDVDADQRRGAERPGERVQRDHHPAPVQHRRDQHGRRAHPDVRQQRREVPQLLHGRNHERPQHRDHARQHRVAAARPGRESRRHHAGLDLRRRVRYQQPARVGLRQGRVPLPRPGSQ